MDVAIENGVWYKPWTWGRAKAAPASVPEPVIQASPELIQIIGLERYQAQMKVTNYDEIKKALQGLVYVLEEKRGDALAMSSYTLMHKDKPFEGTAEAEHFYKVFKRPNEFASQFELIRNTSMLLDQLGNAYWWFGYGNDGRPQEITLLRTEYMRVELDDEGRIAGWVYEKPGKKPMAFAPNEIAHLKYPDPYDMIYGYSVLMRAALDVDIDNIMAESTHGFLRNRAIPPIVVKAEQALNRDQIEEVRHVWNAQLRGKTRAGSTMVVGKGVQVEVLSPDQGQYLFLEGRADVRKRAAAIFGVPEQMFGYVEDANRSIMETSEYVFKSQTVKKLARMFGDALEAFVLPKFGIPPEVDIEIDIDIPVDKEFLLQKYEKGIPLAAYTPDEMRAAFGDEKLPKGKGKRLFRQMSLVEDEPEQPTGQSPAPNLPSPPPSSAEEEEGQPQASINTEPLAGGAGKGVPSDFPGSVLPYKAQRDRRALATERAKQPWLKLMAELVEKFFANEAERLLKALRQRKELREADIEAVLAELQLSIDKYDEVVGDMLVDLTVFFGTSAIEDTGAKITYEHARAVQVVAKGLETRSRLINTTTREKLQGLLQKGIAEGVGRDEIGRRIRELYTDMAPYRAANIARTEVNRATAIAKQDGWRLAGMEGREWVTFPGHRDTAFHNEISGKVAALDEPYPPTGGIMGAMGPSMTGDPGEDCNCRCDEIPVLEMNA